MSEHIHKSHNVSLLLYHLVCPTKYRRVVITDEVDTELKGICFDIANRYEIEFIEIGTDGDHVHFLLQSVPTLSPTAIATKIKSITSVEIFRRVPTLRKQLWGGKFWSAGFYINTVGRHGSEDTIRNYVASQGKTPAEYKQLHVQQLGLF